MPRKSLRLLVFVRWHVIVRAGSVHVVQQEQSLAPGSQWCAVVSGPTARWLCSRYWRCTVHQATRLTAAAGSTNTLFMFAAVSCIFGNCLLHQINSVLRCLIILVTGPRWLVDPDTLGGQIRKHARRLFSIYIQDNWFSMTGDNEPNALSLSLLLFSIINHARRAVSATR